MAVLAKSFWPKPQAGSAKRTRIPPRWLRYRCLSRSSYGVQLKFCRKALLRGFSRVGHQPHWCLCLDLIAGEEPITLTASCSFEPRPTSIGRKGKKKKNSRAWPRRQQGAAIRSRSRHQPPPPKLVFPLRPLCRNTSQSRRWTLNLESRIRNRLASVMRDPICRPYL